IVGNHAACQRFVQPHGGLGRVFAGIAPPGRAGGVGGRHVRGKFTVHNGTAYAALLTASPYCGILVRATLVVGLEPRSNLAEAVKIRSRMYASAQICKEETVRLLLLGQGIVLLPKLKNAIVEHAPVRRGSCWRQLTADSAM